MQNSWDETDEEVARRHLKARSEQPGWAGTIAGIALSLAALLAIALSR